MTKKTKPKESWEEEYDKEFSEEVCPCKFGIKQFIQTLLDKQKRDLIEKARRMNLKDDKTFDFIDSKINPRHHQGFTDGYNQALDDLINKLKE